MIPAQFKRGFSRSISHGLALLAAGTAGLFFLPLGVRALWDSDEGRYAEIAREMIELKSWLVPHLNYVLYFEKPPLQYWLTALSFKVFGPTEFAARFWCAFFGWLTVLLVYRLGKFWRNERVGLLAGALCATSLLFFGLTQFLVLDMALTFWFTLFLYCCSRALMERPVKPIGRFAVLAAVALAGGVLTKGLVAVVLPVLVLGLEVLWAVPRGWTEKVPWLRCALLCFGFCAPWFLWISLEHPAFFQFFFIREHLQRYLTDIHERVAPWYFFLPVVAVGFLPWTVFLPKVFHTFWSDLNPGRGSKSGRHLTGIFQPMLEGLERVWDQLGSCASREPVMYLLGFWCATVFVFFSFSHSKLVGYILPIFPALSLLLGQEFDEALDQPASPGWMSGGVLALLVLFIAGLVALKWPGLVPSSPEWDHLSAHLGLLPVLLGLSVLVLVGLWGLRQPLATFAGTQMIMVVLFSNAAGLAPVIDAFHSTRRLAQKINATARPEDPIVVYGISYDNQAQSLAFYARKRLLVFGPAGELTMGKELDPAASAWFADEPQGTQQLRALPPGTWVLTDAEHSKSLSDDGLPLESFGTEGRLVLLRKTG